jgi:hypothetical protein
MGLWDAFDQAVQPEPSQVVGHVATAVSIGGLPEQLRHVTADVAMADAGGAERKETACLHEGEHAAIADAERGGALGVDDAGLRQRVERIVADQAVVAQVFDAQEAPVGGKADLPQCGQIAQSPTDLEVVRVVDGGFGAECLTVFCGTA